MAIGTPSQSNITNVTITSGVVTANQGTNPWNENITQFGGAPITLGQKLMAASLPIVIASDQSSIPVTGTFFQATQPVSIAATVTVSGTVALSSGSAVIGHVITDSGSVTNATLSAETTKVIGTINIASGQTVGLVAGTAVIGHVIVDSGSITVNTISNFALETGGNLATLAGIVSSNKAAVKMADGDLVTLGAKTDTKSTATDGTSISVMSVLKEISAMVQAPASTPVTGTFWQATQPVSIAGTVTITGTVTANAGTNLNTSLLALESGGNLATITNATSNLDATAVPTKMILVGGESNDATVQYNPIPLGTAGRTVIIEGFSGGTAVPISVGTVTVTGSVNATLAAETTKVIGTVNQGTSPWAVSLAAETTKVIGVVRTADGSGNLLTATSNALDINLKTSSITLPVSGTVTANIGTTNGLALDATLTGGTQQTKITDGTTIASNIAGDSGQNAQVVTSARKEVSFTTTTAQAVASTDVSNYKWVSVHITSQGGSANVTFQGSNDNTNWISISLTNVNTMVTVVNTTSSGIMLAGPLNFRYFRLNVTGIISGTTSGNVEFFSSPAAQITPNTIIGNAVPSGALYIGGLDGSNNIRAILAQNPGDTVGSTGMVTSTLQIFNGTNYDRARTATNTAGTTGLGIIASGILGFDGTNYQRVNTDTSGNVKTIMNGGLAPTGTALNTYSVHITTNTTNTPIASTSYISSIVISAEVGGTTSTVTIQDKQGTPLKLVNGLTTTAATTGPTIYNFTTPVKMVSGIDVITAGAVAATIDVWINYFN